MNLKFKIEYNTIIIILNIIKNFLSTILESNIFGNLWLNIHNNKLKITILNLESQITFFIYIINNSNQNLNNVLIPGKKFFDLCKKLSEYQTLYFSISNKILILKAKNIKFKINLFNINNFPHIYKFNHKPLKFKVNANKFKEILLSTYFAISIKKINKYIINGLNLIINKNNLLCIAGDGYRLSTNSIPIKIENKINISLLVSKKTIVDIINLLEKNKLKNIIIYFSKDYLQINLNNLYFISRLVIGYYPQLYKYKNEIKIEDYKIKFLINKKLLLSAILRINSLTNENIKKIILTIKHNLLILNTNNNLNETAEEYININYENKYHISISLNSVYLIEILNNISSTFIYILIKDIFSSIIIQDIFNKNNFHIIMPLNI